MTNPQDSQNPIPERRKRRVAGLTYDEMIAIFVAFSTIGAILLWTLGIRKGGIAGNFGFGGQSSSLSANNTGIGIGSINANSNVDFGKPELDRGSLKKAERKLKKELSVASASNSKKFSAPTKKEKGDYEISSGSKLASLGVGAVAVPTLANKFQGNRNFNQGNISQGNFSNPNSQVTAPDKVEIPDKTDSQVTAPDKVETPDKTDSQATAPNKVETPDKTDSQATAPDKVETPDKTDSQATAPDKVETPDKTDSQATPPDEASMPDDVAPSYWAYPFVKQMSDQSLVADLTEDRDFEPDKLITRASMATLISQAFDDSPSDERAKRFKDVSNKNAIAADVDQAVKMGFMQGYSDDEFRPLENIPRYQVLVTLATGLGLKPSQDSAQILQKFGDGTDMPDWAKEQVAAAAEAGLIVNRPNVSSNSLSPNESATRGEVAAMIHQALVKTGKLKPLESEYIIKP